MTDYRRTTDVNWFPSLKTQLRQGIIVLLQNIQARSTPSGVHLFMAEKNKAIELFDQW